jgi:vacuolar fusion protein MON1
VASANPGSFSESELSSSAASVAGDIENGNGLVLVKDIDTGDADTSGEEEGAISSPIVQRTPRAPEEIQADSQRLRDQLRKSLNQGQGEFVSVLVYVYIVHKLNAVWIGSTRSKTQREPFDVRELKFDDQFVEPERQFFVLTHAGKPVFTTAKEDDESDDVSNMVGVMHALISVFADEQDKLRCEISLPMALSCVSSIYSCINAPPRRITFVLRSPLYYVCVSSILEPESVVCTLSNCSIPFLTRLQVRIYLDHLHLLLLSVLSSTQLQRILTKHTNFDLRRLLTGTTTLLHSHLARLPTSPGILTSSLHTIRLDPTLRIQVAEALVPPSKLKMKDALYALLVVDDKVVTIARPRKHSIHPADLHVLLATIAAPSIKGTSASWLPICLPKFNASGFLHAYVSFIRSEEDTAEENAEAERKPSIALVLISASGDFDSVRAWSDYTIDKLESSSTIDALLEAARTAEYTLDDLQIPGLRHFIYKSRINVQVTMPHYDLEGSESEFQRIFSLYRTAFDAIHAKGGQESTLRLQYVKTQSVCVMAWVCNSCSPNRRTGIYVRSV